MERSTGKGVNKSKLKVRSQEHTTEKNYMKSRAQNANKIIILYYQNFVIN